MDSDQKPFQWQEIKICFLLPLQIDHTAQTLFFFGQRPKIGKCWPPTLPTPSHSLIQQLDKVYSLLWQKWKLWRCVGKVGVSVEMVVVEQWRSLCSGVVEKEGTTYTSYICPVSACPYWYQSDLNHLWTVDFLLFSFSLPFFFSFYFRLIRMLRGYSVGVRCEMTSFVIRWEQDLKRRRK